MKLNAKQNNLYIVLAFLLPAVLFLGFFALYGFKPFGKYYLLYSDMRHQYAPFFVEFRRALLSGDSLLWNWHIGMGIDYLGLISYYLASPLNLLCVVLPEHLALDYFCMLAPIKLGLASGFFAIMLKKLFQQNDISLTLFGGFYGMCAWAIGYHWNVMWLDAFALLPLIMLGAVQLLRDKQFTLYTLSLFLCVLSNYYVALFVCIFIFLFFICYEICRFRSIRRFFSDLGRIALFSILAVGMTAMLELPALAALQNTQSSVNAFPNGFCINIASQELIDAAQSAWTNYNTADTKTFSLWYTALKASFLAIWQAMQQIAGNLGSELEPTFKEGLPNLYCGVFTVALGFLYLLSKDVKLKDKLCCVGLLTFFGFSFIFRQLDYIWHGMHFPNMIPYRFSFLYSFVMLYMAYRAWLLRNSFAPWQILFCGILSIGLFLWGNSNTNGNLTANMVWLCLYLVLMGYYSVAGRLQLPNASVSQSAPAESAGTNGITAQSGASSPVVPQPKEIRLPSPVKHRKVASFAICVLLLIELFLNIANMWNHYPSAALSNYPFNQVETSAVLKFMEDRERGNPFFRTETIRAQILNDGSLLGYNGISTFTSSVNVKATNFMKHFGFTGRAVDNRYLHENASPVANLFLGLKYMIDRNGEPIDNSYFSAVHQIGELTLLENNAYLPLGFLANNKLQDFDFFDTEAGFAAQNAIFNATTGLDVDLWAYEPDTSFTVAPDSHASVTKSEPGNYHYTVTGEEGELTFICDITTTGLLCLDVTLPRIKDYSVYKTSPGGEEKKLFSNQIIISQLFAVCEVTPGDQIKIVVACEKAEEGDISIRAATLQKDTFLQGYQLLQDSTLNLTHFTNTLVQGNIHCDRDGLLYTSIPQNGNWTVYVDGEPVDTVLVGDVMLSIPITEGTHTVAFRYRNRAFELGTVISIGCALIFLGTVIISRNKKHK